MHVTNVNSVSLEKNDAPFVQNLIYQLTRNKKVKIYRKSEVAKAKGFVGNFKVEIETPDGKEDIEIGSIVVATKTRMNADSDGGDFEKDLLLQRDERNFFVGMLGMLNPLEFNTESTMSNSVMRPHKNVIVRFGQAEHSEVHAILAGNVY